MPIFLVEKVNMMLMKLPHPILVMVLLSNIPVNSTESTHNLQFVMNYSANDILLYPFEDTKKHISSDEDDPRTKTSLGLLRRRISQPFKDPERHVFSEEYAPLTRTRRNSSRRMISRPFFLKLLKSLGIHVRFNWKRNQLQLLLWS
ncbi:uncharacterized protein LOC134723699 [Mytilus trossulus]|uniref:uncharacterized protein LOC134723699 n=1 Tax=Mytilus trossulus TaxID=6551 RepID=UPI0030060DB2